jgi:hypothetical protein
MDQDFVGKPAQSDEQRSSLSNILLAIKVIVESLVNESQGEVDVFCKHIVARIVQTDQEVLFSFPRSAWEPGKQETKVYQ